MRASIHRSRLRQTVEINMTPLMDLTFTLLIVFIITVPVLDYSTNVNVDAPEMTTPTQVATGDDSIILAMDKNGNCLMKSSCRFLLCMSVWSAGSNALRDAQPLTAPAVTPST